MSVKEIKQKLQIAVKDVYSLEIDFNSITIEHPNEESWGDYATNIALVLAKDLKQSPMEIAKTLCYEMSSNNQTFEFEGISYPIYSKIYPASPGFINFVFSREWLYFVLLNIIDIGDSYGSEELLPSKKILIEFSQPNPNKPQHIGHARNNFLGASVANIKEFLGYDVLRANYVNDWGTHICKAMLMYSKYGNDMAPTKQSDHFVGDFYIMYEKEEEKNPEIKDEVAEVFRKLEAGDPGTLDLWNKIVSWSIEGWGRTYGDQNINFDIWFRQSNYKNTGKEIVNIALEKGIAEKDETGKVVARLTKYDIPDKVLLRADGTSVYSTQDLQMAKDNIEEYGLDKRIYVVDYRQEDYFQQIFKILEVLGFDGVNKLYHLSYGTVELPEGKMSSRTGLVVNADEVFEKLISLEDQEVSGDLLNRESIVRAVAMAAFKYALLKYDPKSNITFNYDEVTKFSGNTGPYLLYARARANSILDKSVLNFDLALYTYGIGPIASQIVPKEMDLLRFLYRFPEVVQRSSEEYAPNIICNYLFDLAQRFNTFYNDVPILIEKDDDLKRFRLVLTQCFVIVMTNGLNLLGIPMPSRM